MRKWLHSRATPITMRNIDQQTVPDFLAYVQENLGKSAVDKLNLLMPTTLTSVFHVPESEVLDFIWKFQTVADFATAQINAQKSNFHKDLLKKTVQQSANEFSWKLKELSLSDLQKAIQPKDWKRITSKHNEDAHLVSDYKPHIQQFPAPEEYSQLLSDPKMFKPHSLENNGISAKMVHDAKGYTDSEGQWTSRAKSNIYMAKPYHKNIEAATKSWVKHPILGWATMATKALFNAAGIGHQAEDVSTHEHQGTPLTVHKFADDSFRPMMQYRQLQPKHLNVKPLDVHQIGVMDYLTNNLDRHGGNLLLNDNKTEEGYHPLLAIDHERNFQYSQHLKDKAFLHKDPFYTSRLAPYMKQENPLSYINHQATGTAALSAFDWFSHHELVDWWTQHGKNIKTELESQVQHIKDEHVRKHVRDNFTNRWHKMNDWTQKMQADPEGSDMYRHDSLGDTFDDVKNTQPETPKITDKQLKLLPKNKKDALLSISDIINRKEKLTNKQRSILSSAIDHTINQMSPDEAAETFRSIIDNPYMKTKAVKKHPELDAKNRMLRIFSDASTWANNEPQYKYDHLESMANVIDSLPAEKKETLGYWADHYRRLLREREERQVS